MWWCSLCGTIRHGRGGHVAGGGIHRLADRADGVPERDHCHGPGIATAGNVFDNYGRNLILNGRFNIQQRGTGAWTTSNVYTADRWQMSVVGDSDLISLTGLSDTDRSAIGDESAQYALTAAITGVNSAANFSQIIQRILDARRTSNKTVTISFWAKASTSLNLGAYLFQGFGTGGSPSAAVVVAPTTFAVTTTWTRYQVAVAVPSTSGKTFGSNADSSLALAFGFSSGSTYASQVGVGVQSGTWMIWGVQLEIGSVATPLEARDAADELFRCQFFYAIGQIYWEGYAVSGATILASAPPPRTMRIIPTLAITTNANTNISSPAITANNQIIASSGTASATGTVVLNIVYTASADL